MGVRDGERPPTPVFFIQQAHVDDTQTPLPRKRADAAHWKLFYPEGLSEDDLPRYAAKLVQDLHEMMRYLWHPVDKQDEEHLEDDWVILEEESVWLIGDPGLRGPERLAVFVQSLRALLPVCLGDNVGQLPLIEVSSRPASLGPGRLT